jgi:pyruvate/2-oxoglutarate dehydrogenase complex dihydrolipoamide dehydrogenase (E3) component
MSAEHFEYAVVGAGKGGKTLAAQMASSGRHVVMIEKGMIGGTCINVACVPTKTMVKSAKVAELARRAAAIGIRVQFDGADPVGVRQRKRAVVAEMVGRNQTNFDNTGTRPALPEIPGLATARPLNSESIQELDRLPEHLIFLGGYVGCEFAQMFRRFGSQVTLIERSEAFLPREDPDVAQRVLEIFQDFAVKRGAELVDYAADGVERHGRMTASASATAALFDATALAPTAAATRSASPAVAALIETACPRP